MAVYTTPNGTVWNSYQASIPGHRFCRWMVADNVVANPDLPVILFLHGSNGAANQFETSPGSPGPGGFRDIRNWLMDSGYVVVEGTGGPTDAAGQANWGNDAGVAAYLAYYLHVASVLSLGPLVVMGRSMGGLGAYRLCAYDPTIRANLAGMMISSGVTPLTDNYALGKFNPAMSNAWGAPSVNTIETPQNDRQPELPEYVADFQAANASKDPINFPPSVWDGMNILQLVGTADTSVVPAKNADVIRATWAGHPAIDRIDIMPGGTHGNETGTYIRVDAMSQFLVDVTGVGTPTGGGTPAERKIYVIEDEWIMLNGRLHSVVPMI